mmetsp:Transcript_57079/g.169705  ORF Transcript_57079/g.169705 Transcript_57079/m.169705 type:complete len:232 (-) Transcript_57079:742-1437(-)
MTLRVEFQPKRLHRANRHDPQDLQVAPPAGPRAVHKIDREEQLGDGEADESRPWGRHVPLVRGRHEKRRIDGHRKPDAEGHQGREQLRRAKDSSLADEERGGGILHLRKVSGVSVCKMIPELLLDLGQVDEDLAIVPNRVTNRRDGGLRLQESLKERLARLPQHAQQAAGDVLDAARLHLQVIGDQGVEAHHLVRPPGERASEEDGVRQRGVGLCPEALHKGADEQLRRAP